MTAKALQDMMGTIGAWPEAAQEELAAIAREMDKELRSGVYHATPQELAGIDRGLKDADAGRFATDVQIEAVFAKHRA